MTTIDCLFDTNAIIKRYHGERGTKIVDYLFEKSRRININLLAIQVVEVIKTFYKLRSDNKIKTDDARDVAIHSFLKDIDNSDGVGKIKLYDFVRRHLLDMDVYGPITNVETKFAEVWNPELKKRELKPKARPNTVDTIMLILMREIKIVNEGYGLKSYLVTSDEYMIDVAQSFGIFVVNPEAESIGTLPSDLDTREHKRHKLQLKAICKDLQTGQSLGSTSTVDICEKGLGVRQLVNLTQGRIVNFRLEAFDGSCAPLETCGEICWSWSGHCGVKLTELVPVDFFNSLHVN
ncbi:MAG: hypothetical protein WC574_05350 [Candidatus Omnitrophota bacterium]